MKEAILNKLLVCLLGVAVIFVPFGKALFVGSDIVNAQTEDGIVLYFYDSDFEQIPVTRGVRGDINPKLLVNELLKGPKAMDSLQFTIPKGTSLIGYETKDGIVYLNFSKEINNYSDTTRWDWLESIVLTIFSNTEIKGVQFLIDGAIQDVYSNEGIWIGSPRFRYFRDINPVSSSTGDWVLGNLYIPEQIGKKVYLVPHTLSVPEQLTGSNSVRTILEALLKAKEMQSLQRSIIDFKFQEDTVIISLDSQKINFPAQEGRNLNDFISAVLYTISEIPDVKYLKVLMDGSPIPKKYGVEAIQAVPINKGDYYVLPVGINPE